MGTKSISHTSRRGRRPAQSGFTIIEVSLFLGLSALLAVLLLTGWTTMLNTQRYKDSVRTLQSFVQQQYNLTYNVENERADDLVCGAEADIDTGGNSTTPTIGQSDCVIMGRYIVIEDGLNLTVSSIVGREPSEDDIEDDDTLYEAILRYQPKRVEVPIGLTDKELTVPWDAVITDVGGDTTPQKHAIAIVRAPSGIVQTFVWKNIPNPATPPLLNAAFISPSPDRQQDLNLCLDAGAPLTVGRMGVVIRKGASAQSSVQAIADGDDVC